ncbi:MotE family protein [Consotaella aegiceratis]|uniref:MotE family protein n=1 Tax=Consotaella aegiceratis TaxID=3097961 RepID=UPI002F41D736
MMKPIHILTRPVRPAAAASALLIAMAVPLMLGSTTVMAQETENPAQADEAAVVPVQQVRRIGADGTVETARQDGSEVERYCLNIADKAQDARYVIQAERLKELEKQIETRIADLEAKRQEYQDWLQKRQQFIDSASPVVIDIYAKMPADAAAAQLTSIDRKSAAAILVKLKSRTASDIMSEMPAQTAAELANLIIQTTMDPDAPSLTTEKQS